MLKRTLSIIMSVFMLVCLCVPALAADSTEPEQPFSWEAYELVATYLQNNGYIQLADDETLEILPFPEDVFNPEIVEAILGYVNEFINPMILQGMITLDESFSVHITDMYVEYANAMIDEDSVLLREYGFDFRAGIGDNPNILLVKNYADDAGQTRIEMHWFYYYIYLSNEAVLVVEDAVMFTGIICLFMPQPEGAALAALLLLYSKIIKDHNTNGMGVVIRMIYPPLPGIVTGIWAQ